MKTIQCEEIKKFYGEGENRTTALRGVNLDINEGQLTVLIGPSGSGKTTLLSIIYTILTPDEGKLTILGHPINGMNQFEKAKFRSQNLGIIFQGLYLIPTLTVLENTILPSTILGEDEERARNKATDILHQLDIGKKIHSPPTQLSKGQQQRVAIARALMNEPKVIMCDEPTSALDQTTGSEVISILRDLATQGNRTVLVVTHDQRLFPFADRIVKINDGRVEEHNG